MLGVLGTFWESENLGRDIRRSTRDIWGVGQIGDIGCIRDIRVIRDLRDIRYWGY